MKKHYNKCKINISCKDASGKEGIVMGNKADAEDIAIAGKNSGNIELYLVSGFLGSGKTTFLKKMLSEEGSGRTGVIVNEFGRESIDGKILSRDGISLVELNNGSIFCACLKANFVKALVTFLSRPIDRLFIEASGMADPSSMEKLLEELTPLVQKKYDITRKYDYMGAVCLVDAGHFLGLSEFLNPVISQVRKSTLVILNKIDTVTGQGALMVKNRIKEINPDVSIMEACYADVPSEVIRQYMHGESIHIDESLNQQSNRPFGGSLYMPSFAGDMDVEGFLRDVAPRMIRMKGFFYKGKQLYHADCVAQDIKIEPTDVDADELANEIILISDSSQDISDYINEKMKEHFGEDLSKVIFLPN